MANELVQPLAPEVAPTEASSSTPEWPQALIENPVMQGLVAGAPPAVSASIKDFQKREEAKLFIDNKDLLMQAGMGLYRSLDGGTGVIFNQRFLNGEALKQADQAGQLAQVAPPFDSVEGEISKSGLNHPSIRGGAQPTGAASAPPPMVAPASAALPPPPASSQRKALTAQISNLQPGSPTSGPAPGAGNLLRSILKPVV